MREEEVYAWRVLWIGKWHTTRFKCSEAFIRETHPEAIRLDSTREVRQIPETEAERILTRSSGAIFVCRPKIGR